MHNVEPKQSGRAHSGGRSGNAGQQWRRHGAAGHLGVADGAFRGQDQPRGADRGGARELLLHGSLRDPGGSGHVPEHLEVSATVTFAKEEGGYNLLRMYPCGMSGGEGT